MVGAGNGPGPDSKAKKSKKKKHVLAGTGSSSLAERPAPALRRTTDIFVPRAGAGDGASDNKSLFGAKLRGLVQSEAPVPVKGRAPSIWAVQPISANQSAPQRLARLPVGARTADLLFIVYVRRGKSDPQRPPFDGFDARSVWHLHQNPKCRNQFVDFFFIFWLRLAHVIIKQLRRCVVTFNSS